MEKFCEYNILSSGHMQMISSWMILATVSLKHTSLRTQKNTQNTLIQNNILLYKPCDREGIVIDIVKKSHFIKSNQFQLLYSLYIKRHPLSLPLILSEEKLAKLRKWLKKAQEKPQRRDPSQGRQ